MISFSQQSVIGVIGAGTMGSGIAQVAAEAGHRVLLYDADPDMPGRAAKALRGVLDKLISKGKMDEARARGIEARITGCKSLQELSPCHLVIEAIVEDPGIKQKVFAALEGICSEDAVLATNTSSLSVTSIAAACKHPSRVLGIHFFNPAPLMPLVEIIPGIASSHAATTAVTALISGWGKATVRVKDTPGFIVNRVARSFYGESIRIFEERWNGLPEGESGLATVDWALKEFGGFKMGPFELMDMIGNDINYTVTETVWRQFFFDPRFKPSLTQKRLTEAGRLGRKSGRGYYDYSEGAVRPEPLQDRELGQAIFHRVLCMLINEAADALCLGVASREDLDLAMTKGVNYPKGLLKWCDEIGVSKVLDTLDQLREEYGEERYRASVLLRKMAREKTTFYH